GEVQLHLQFLRAPHEAENLLRLLRQALQFARQPRQRLVQRQKLVSVLFQKLAARLEGKASFTSGQEGKKELRPLAQTSQRSRQRSGKHSVMLQGRFDIPCQILNSQVAHRDSKVASSHILQFVSFIKNHGGCFRQDARVGRSVSLELDGKIGEEKMMVDDDDVTLHPPPSHFRNKAALPFAALLPDAGIRASIQLVPKRAGFG